MDPFDLASKLADIAVSKYDVLKYDPHYTIWGLALHYDSASERLHPEVQDSEYRSLETLEHDEVVAVAPQKDPLQTLVHACVQNESVVTEFFYDLSGDSVAARHLSGRSLLCEAAHQFAVSPAGHFWDFLLTHTTSESIPTCYRHLFERFYHQVEEDKFDAHLLSLLPPHLAAQVKRKNDEFVNSIPTIDEQATTLLERVVPSRSADVLQLPKINQGKYLGKVRVRGGRRGHTIDWDAYIEERKKRLHACLAVDRNKWVSRLSYFGLSNEAWSEYEASPQKTLLKYIALRDAEQNELLREAYAEIVREFEVISIFDSQTIMEGEMTINVVKKEIQNE